MYSTMPELTVQAFWKSHHSISTASCQRQEKGETSALKGRIMKCCFLRKGKLSGREEQGKKKQMGSGDVLCAHCEWQLQPCSSLCSLQRLYFSEIWVSQMCSRNAEAWSEWSMNGLKGSLQSHRESLSKFIVLI